MHCMAQYGRKSNYNKVRSKLDEWFYRTGTVSTYAFPCATHVFFSTVGTCVSACFFRKAGGRCIGTLYGTSTVRSKQPMPDGEPMVRRTLRST